MNKFYLLMTAALVAGTASAVEKEMIAPKVGNQIKAQKSMLKVAPNAVESPKTQLTKAEMKKVPLKTSKAEEYTFFLPDESIWALGYDLEGSYYAGLGFASPYGELVFNNYSVGAESQVWTFANVNDYEIVNNKVVWNTQTSDVENLAIKSTVGEMMAPSLTVNFSEGEETYSLTTTEYLIGGSAQYWFGADNTLGITSYQNIGLLDPSGFSGGRTYKNSYRPGTSGFNANGVYIDPTNPNNWANMVSDAFDGAEITNLSLDKFYIIQPEPKSTYFMTSGWGSISVEATKATTLTSYIYPIEDGLISDAPIAIGYASVPRGSSNTLVFEYFALNEDGDEIEGDIFIDSAVAISIEGFKDNSDIKTLSPASGYYPFSYEAYASGNYDIIRDPALYLEFSAEADGTPGSVILYDRGLYFFDQSTKPDGSYTDEDTLSMMDYPQFMVDATFPWILPVNGEESVTLPLAGGNTDVTVNALYFNINAMLEDEIYSLSTPDWVTVDFGDSDQKTGDTTMTITVDESAENRTGDIVLEGLGVGMTIKVIQGEDSGVNEIEAVSADAVYYDLQGRKLNNAPEKGIYIVKEGNKVSKVIR